MKADGVANPDLDGCDSFVRSDAAQQILRIGRIPQNCTIPVKAGAAGKCQTEWVNLDECG